MTQPTNREFMVPSRENDSAVAERETCPALILMYHRVAEVSPDPWGLCVTPQHFAEHLEVLRSCGRPLPLQELADELATDSVSDRAVVVTLDDGYADNLHNGMPLLCQYDVPATVFITSGCIDSVNEFWWDELERLILHSRELPETLDLNINQITHHWELPNSKDGNSDSSDRFSDWRAWNVPRHPRTSLYRSLWRLLRPLREDARQEVRQQLRAWAGAALTMRPTHRPLRHDEVVDLAGEELIEIGAHTVTHPMLPTLLPDEQLEEIQDCKADLEEMIGSVVTQFSYPYGSFSEETRAIVQNCEFTCACSTQARRVPAGANRFALPRVQVHDWGGEQFSRWLTLRPGGD